jgi:ribosomal protein S18 acetylase RimI-like enzyme
MGAESEIILCPPAARIAALRVLYQRVPQTSREKLISEVLEESLRGEIDLSGLWIARERAGRITGALLTQPLAGNSVAVWAPEVQQSWRRSAIAAALVRTALGSLKSQGFALAQAVLDESADPRASSDLARGGMPRVTDLLYLERDTAIPLEILVPRNPEFKQSLQPARVGCVSRLIWRSFDPATEGEFRAVMEETYEGSLDMPELEGTRSLDQILEGHQAAGRFVPQRWCLGRIPGEPDVGAVLLMSEVPDGSAWEIVYLGLTPAARGRGLGLAAIAHALELARPHVPRLELAVDLRNKPAVRLYKHANFSARDRRTVHLAVLTDARSRKPAREIAAT